MGPSDEAAPFTEEEEAFLAALQPAVMAMTQAFDKAMRTQGLTRTEYFVLLALSKAPDHTMKLGDLAGLCHVSPPVLGRTVQALAAEGLLLREQARHDARSFNAVLTDTGRTRLEQALPVYVATLRRLVLDHLHREDLDVGKLAAAWQRMAETA
ncbi:MarR family winged helix-turn-helix transcriptional regulator [Streptomyces sp. NPDC101234]|uniref:MarR family winged helix-turn-helix transcriptional regulator n=1 Tax=Streptomyces sp. NPDC101234 TaxID=3366138 RepID=UPI0037F95572